MTAAAAPGPLPRRVALADLGIVPLIASLPFLYVPKVLEGDTQPWVLLGAIIAFFTWRPRLFVQTRDLAPILLAVLALLAYVARGGLTEETLRAAYIFLTFAVLWVLSGRGGHDAFRQGVRLTLAIWFLVGLYQFAALRLGLPIEFAGRFMAGRNALPSLAAEPSYYGSLSVLMAMFLLHDRRRGDGWFVGIAVLNVLLSGSLLAILLLVFPFLYLKFPVKLVAAAAIAAALLFDATFNEAGLTARVAGFQSAGHGLVSIFLDPSLNLRIGHVWFALWENLPASLAFAHPLGFQAQYNAFAAGTGVLIPTESNFILPIAGELVFNGGLFGLALAILIVVAAWRGGARPGDRLIRSAFAIVCLLNPVSVANPFLIFYVTQGRMWRPR